MCRRIHWLLERMELLVKGARNDPALYDVSGCAGLTGVNLAEQLLSPSGKRLKT